MIEKLTPLQEKQLIEFREEWLKIGLCTDPADRSLAESALKRIYKNHLNLEKPYFWWVDSPMMANLIISILKYVGKEKLGANLMGNLWVNLEDNLRANLGDNLEANLLANIMANLMANLWANLRANLSDNLGANLGANLRANLWANLRANLWANLKANLRANLEANLRANLWDNLEANLEANLRANLMANLEANLWANLEANLWDNLMANLFANLKANLRDKDLFEPTNLWGQQDSYWIAFYLFPRSFLKGINYGKDKNEQLDAWSDYAKSCNWVWLFKDICFVCDRPKLILRDLQGRLHADGKMACQYRDDWGIYVWHGVNIPEKYGAVRSEQWESKWILEEKNAELRRILIQGIGYGKICRDLNAKVLDSWKEYELLRIDDVDVEPIVMVKMTCPSTGLIHAHRVDPNCKTAREGIKWINHGIDKEEFLIER